MKRSRNILIYGLIACGFIFSLIKNIPAWIMGSTLEHYSQNRISMSNENGSFWHGEALLLAHDETGKKTVPLMMVGWKIKFGWSKFITVNLTASNQTIASASLSKSGLGVNNVDVGLSLDQLTPFLGNMNTLNLSGNVHVTANGLEIGKKMNGSVNVQLSNVGSGISPVNPVGSYGVNINLASGSLSVTTSDPAAVLTVTGDGSLNSLTLNSKVAPEKKDQLLQFMTMMGIPQADGSYQMKVF